MKYKKRRNDPLSTETRQMLLHLVTKENYSIRKASKLLMMNYTTAKSLMVKYRLNGHINRKYNLVTVKSNDPKILHRKRLLKSMKTES